MFDSLTLGEPPTRPIATKSRALHIQSVVQGAFVLAKALGDPEAARQSCDHLRNHLELLFNRPTHKTHKEPKP